MRAAVRCLAAPFAPCREARPPRPARAPGSPAPAPPTPHTHCPAQVFGSLTVTFFLLAGGVFSPTCALAAGYVGAFCGLSAIYTAFAELYHETLGVSFPGIKPVRLI
jgi:hypothetical protein